MNKTVFVFLWLTVIIFIFIGSNVFAAGFQSKQITAGHQPIQAPVTPQSLSDIRLDNSLNWDSETKVTTVTSGQSNAHLAFNFTNVSSGNVTITDVHTSCGCTTAQLPVLPWIIQPGTNGQIGITVNLAGKSGTLFKSATVNTDKGSKVLYVKIGILPPIASVAFTTNQPDNFQAPEQRQSNGGILSPANQIPDLPTAQAMLDPNRSRSFQMAKVDRQAVFRGDCASCHVKPTEGKYGKELFYAACGICHEGERRATMVPDLHHLTVPTSPDFWQTWISMGKTNSLMPAFSKKEGGPLTKSQIVSLAKYLAKVIPSRTNQFE